MAWTRRTKLINQLINRDGGVYEVMYCPIGIGKDLEWCEKHLLCADCINAWLDEEVEYEPEEEKENDK